MSLILFRYFLDTFYEYVEEFLERSKHIMNALEEFYCFYTINLPKLVNVNKTWKKKNIRTRMTY